MSMASHAASRDRSVGVIFLFGSIVIRNWQPPAESWDILADGAEGNESWPR